MNTTWKQFLLDRKALGSDESPKLSPAADNTGRKSIYPLVHLGVLKVSGNDAAKLLQGQITCNVNDINETRSSFAAMCNPKGRAIATFLLVKQADGFLLVLPVELMETVQKKMQMYVLRSDAKIEDVRDAICLVGLCEPGHAVQPFVTETQDKIVCVNFPGSTSRNIVLTDADTAIQIWLGHVDSKGFIQAGADEWRMHDILSGIPWLTTTTSEEFVPQMFNLDKIGGISFNKGCYTGQEIVARTHYLGKAKREMLLAKCLTVALPEPNATILNRDSDPPEVVGKVLQAQHDGQSCKMLVVLQTTEGHFNNLGLANDDQARLTLLPLTYD